MKRYNKDIDGPTLAAIECMDGRPGNAVRDAALKLGIRRVDSISAPGVVKDLQEEMPDWVKARLEIARHHGARRVWVVAHDECAGNPVDKKIQKQQVRQAVALVGEVFPDMRVQGFWSERRTKHPEKGWILKRVR